MRHTQRRKFLGQIALAGAVPFLPNSILRESDFSSLAEYRNGVSASALIMDEKFWYQVKAMYSSSPGLLNLNNGGVSPQPLIVQEAHERYNKMSNEAPSYYMLSLIHI